MHTTGRGLKMIVSADGKGLVSQSGGLLLTRTLAVTGLDLACRPRWIGGGRRGRSTILAR